MCVISVHVYIIAVPVCVFMILNAEHIFGKIYKRLLTVVISKGEEGYWGGEFFTFHFTSFCVDYFFFFYHD